MPGAVAGLFEQFALGAGEGLVGIEFAGWQFEDLATG